MSSLPQLLKTGKFRDNILCYFTASFAAVRSGLFVPADRAPSRQPSAPPPRPKATSPSPSPVPLARADGTQSRIMNASVPGQTYVPLSFSSTLRIVVCPYADTPPRSQHSASSAHRSRTRDPCSCSKGGWVPAWTWLQPTTILIFRTLEQLKNLVDFSRAQGWGSVCKLLQTVSDRITHGMAKYNEIRATLVNFGSALRKKGSLMLISLGSQRWKLLESDAVDREEKQE
ncbi:hypothetical protein C0992_001704, partial [Termitomyces sp. T32_za158]